MGMGSVASYSFMSWHIGVGGRGVYMLLNEGMDIIVKALF
jgi:hypothetical protein